MCIIGCRVIVAICSLVTQQLFLVNGYSILEPQAAFRTIIVTIQVRLMSQSWDNVVSMHDHLLTVHAHKT